MRLFNLTFLYRSLLLVGFIGLVVASLHSEIFQIKTLSVEESTESVSPEVYQSVRDEANRIANAYIGQNIWWVNVSQISEKVKKINGVKDVIVERLPPDSLKVTILPEEIRLLYITREGGVFPITESAKVLGHFEPGLHPDAPIVRNKKVINNSKILSQAVELISNLPPSGLISRNSVSEIELDSKSDFWLSLMQSDSKVRMNAKNSNIKVERVERVLDYLQRHNLHARVIDSEYSKKVVVKLRKDR